jgi:uncharacterized membrane protein YbhN (UPF0104 family)
MSLDPRLRYLALGVKLLVVPAAATMLAWKVTENSAVSVDHIDKWLLIAALAANQVALLLFAVRMQLAMRAFGIALGTLQSLRIHLQSIFYFFALPMTVGLEVARFAKIRNAAQVTPASGPLTLALVADRLIGATSALALAAVLLPVVGFNAAIRWDDAAPWLIAAACVLVIGAFAFSRKLVRHRLAQITELLRRSGPGMWACFAVAILTHACFALGVYLAAQAAHVDITLVQTMFFVSAAMLFVVLPVSLAGVSPVEAAGFGVLVGLGIAPQHAAVAVVIAYLAKLIGAFEGAAWEIYEGGWDALRILLTKQKAGP